MPKAGWVKVLATIGSILAALVSWQALGWPRPLLQSDILPVVKELGDVRTLAQSNTLRILQTDWWRYERDIEEENLALIAKPADKRIRANLRRLRREQAAIQDEIDQLKRR
jgi:hypothetical protein